MTTKFQINRMLVGWFFPTLLTQYEKQLDVMPAEHRFQTRPNGYTLYGIIFNELKENT